VQQPLQWRSNKYSHSECLFVASVIQHAMSKRHVVTYGLSTLSHKLQEHKIGVLDSSTTFV